MFRRNRERLERLEKLQEQMVNSINGLAQKLEDKPAVAPVDAMGLLVTAFTSMAGNQAEMINAFGEIAVKSAAKRAGIRGGKARTLNAARDKNGRLLPNSAKRVSMVPRGESRCRLCVDKDLRDPSISEIVAHRNHSVVVRPEAVEGIGDQNGDSNNNSGFVDPFSVASAGPA